MSLRDRLLIGGALGLCAAGFAWLNGGEHVALNLGLLRFESIPLSIVVFAAFLLGMLVLFLASLKAELRTQRMLRRYREVLGREPAPPPNDDGSARQAGPAADEA